MIYPHPIYNTKTSILPNLPQQQSNQNMPPHPQRIRPPPSVTDLKVLFSHIENPPKESTFFLSTAYSYILPKPSPIPLH